MKEKNAWKEISLALGIDIVSPQTNYNNTRIFFIRNRFIRNLELGILK